MRMDTRFDAFFGSRAGKALTALILPLFALLAPGNDHSKQAQWDGSL